MTKKLLSLSGNFLDEISIYKTIYCLISGGYHSTSAALLLYDYGFKNVCLVHNRTYLEFKHVLDLIQDIIYRTDYSYIETKPNLHGKRVGQIIKESMNKVDDIVQYFIDDRMDYKDFIPCCKLLKKSPSRKLYTREIDKSNSVIISSLCPFESKNRGRWLKQLRDKDTYIRLHKKFGNVWHAYPFRDMYSNMPFHFYLLSKGIIPEHSGCVICPIQVAYGKFMELKQKRRKELEEHIKAEERYKRERNPRHLFHWLGKNV
ncbi:hypothetical protein LCGC14_0956600 [marine sediment metagenome]|uniref:Phosphoadenosine phosphosulphate reductase domain-containing protein n=1 Tax=marine sediment metagenome TaxID=412755 RepID=A0A0F9NFM8_9ZZZZ